MNTHRSLLAWQACRILTAEIYKATQKFPACERFGLTAQMRRAAVSAASNIAEGWARTGPRETLHGLSIAIGSLAEIDSLLAVAEDLEYLTAEVLMRLEQLRAQASKLVFGLMRSMRQKIRE